jgi:nucleoside-diphosphate-sugar epimerase
MSWDGRRVLVTGGASFIGSHLVDALVERGAQVRVVDDLSSGVRENLAPHLASGRVELVEADLRRALDAVAGQGVVFHLAAAHGGRGYVDLHQAECATNLALDGALFLACRDAGVEKIVYASSGCVYPNFRQTDPGAIAYLREDMVGPPYDADNLYGWAKLMGELTLRAWCAEWGMRAASCRYFTVYGSRGHENHAVLAMIARGFVRQDPFQVWGTGQQIRNWTHVSDIVSGTLLAAERIDDGTAVNLGTMERTRVADAVAQVTRFFGYDPKLEFLPGMPTGPLNRVADNALARELLGWEPRVRFADGLADTAAWYAASHDPAGVRASLERRLTER